MLHRRRCSDHGQPGECSKLVSQVREFRNPPRYLTQDWRAARESVERLADLRPNLVASGHGLPVSGNWVPDELQRFAAEFKTAGSRSLCKQSCAGCEYGILYVPPAPAQPVPYVRRRSRFGSRRGVAMVAANRRKRNNGASDRETAEMANYERYRRDGYRD